MIVQMLNSDKVDKKWIERYHETTRYLEQLPNCFESADEVRAENDLDQFLTNDNFDIDNNEAFYDNEDTFSEAQADWEACDATLPIGWMYSYSAGHKTYKSPCGEVLYSREKIVDFMLGKGLEIYHPKGYSGITAQNIDCDGYCEGACDAFKIYRKYYKPFDPNRIRKKTKINFVDDESIHFIKDSLIHIQTKPENDLKPITSFPAVIKGIRPWIICMKEENEQLNEFNRRAVPQSKSKAVSNIPKKKVAKRKRSGSTESSNCHNSGIENSSTCSSRESTPSGFSRVSKQRRPNKKQTEYEAIYVQCCKKSCQKWRLVTQYEDASSVPDYWVCSMNRDKENSKCGVGGNAFNGDSDKIEIKFSCGSLVWAKLKGFPWWPGMIDFCPDSDDYFWVDEDISEREPAWYHVVYFEGKGTEVTRAWIKSGDIVSMKTPIQQPNGNTLKKPGPLKKRLLNAVHIAEEAKKLKRSERVNKYSFEKLSSSNELKKDKKKRIKITPEPSSKSLTKHISKPSSRPVKQVNQSKKQFIPASFLNPVFSDESDKSDLSDQEDNNIAMKKPVIVESNNFNVNPEKEIHIDPNSRTIKGQGGNNEFDLLSEIMQKYSDETETEKHKEYNILDDDFSVSGSENEDNANDASLEESSDVGVSSFVIKEENIDSNVNDTGPMIHSVTSQCMTEMFIKPEELVSTFNPNLDKVFPKPPLPSDVLIALAVRNLDPSNDFGTTETDIVSFLAIHFPYYNRNIEECKEMVANARENDDKTEKHVFHIQSSTFTEISQKIEKLLEKNKSLVLDSMLIQGFLDSMVEKFRKDFKCEAVSFRPPYSCKMLSYLAFITLCPPISMGQVMTFLKFLFPSLLGKNTFEIEDLEEWIKNDEHVQDLTTPTGEKLFLLKEGVYPTVLHQVRQFFSTKSNFTRLNKSILKSEFVEFLLPNLLGS